MFDSRTCLLWEISFNIIFVYNLSPNKRAMKKYFSSEHEQTKDTSLWSRASVSPDESTSGGCATTYNKTNPFSAKGKGFGENANIFQGFAEGGGKRTTAVTSSASETLCNNCGKYGHIFYMCNLPITSCGIIAMRTNPKPTQNTREARENKLEYLMIRRKNSFGYIDFLCGNYSIQNRSHLLKLIDEMSIPEKSALLEHSFLELWTSMWEGSPEYKSKHSTTIAHTNSQKKFEQLVESGELRQLISESSTNWTETEWEFPKGRKTAREKDLNCAIREFNEETGIPQNKLRIIENVLPYEEMYIGSNYKSYKHKYYTAYIEFSDGGGDSNDRAYTGGTGFQESEVSKIEWKTYRECVAAIRPYHTEKIAMLTNINSTFGRHAELYECSSGTLGVAAATAMHEAFA